MSIRNEVPLLKDLISVVIGVFFFLFGSVRPSSSCSSESVDAVASDCSVSVVSSDCSVSVVSSAGGGVPFLTFLTFAMSGGGALVFRADRFLQH